MQSRNLSGKYLQHSLQAPAHIIRKYRYIRDPARRLFAGMLHKLDESLGKLRFQMCKKCAIKKIDSRFQNWDLDNDK